MLRSRQLRLLACALVGAASLASSSGRADQQEEVATASFRRGAEAYAHHNFRDAALAFEAAHRVVPHGATIYNAALAWAGANEELRAADDFAAALALSDLDAARSSDADKRLGDLEKKLGRIEVAAPPGAKVTVDGVTSGAPLARLHVAPGEHDVHVVLTDGTQSTRHVSVARGANVRVELAPQAPPPTPVAQPTSKPE